MSSANVHPIVSKTNPVEFSALAENPRRVSILQIIVTFGSSRRWRGATNDTLLSQNKGSALGHLKTRSPEEMEPRGGLTDSWCPCVLRSPRESLLDNSSGLRIIARGPIGVTKDNARTCQVFLKNGRMSLVCGTFLFMGSNRMGKLLSLSDWGG